MIQRADIVLARFPFVDQAGSKIRPVLILAEIPGPHRDFLVMFISSQLHQALPGIDLIVSPAHPAFAHTGLKTASVFKVFKIASLSQALVLGPIGHLDDDVFHVLIDRLICLLRTGRMS
ncbi:MAG: type II toxin-antitoxin system PemK/MazF family toxin [Anaerolineae bacterium]|nr:type II toxin-antitoxin system PemK/MazF family toxin [Anaerolineae bacterium]